MKISIESGVVKASVVIPDDAQLSDVLLMIKTSLIAIGYVYVEEVQVIKKKGEDSADVIVSSQDAFS